MFDGERLGRHNRFGMQSPWRTALVLALAPWLVLLSVTPPEHVHEADDHHPSAVTHRHFASHDHDGAEISQDEGRVLWLDDLALPQAGYQFAVALGVVPVGFDACTNPTSWIAVSTLDGAPPHGPPRAATSLRGPPSLSA